MFDDHAGATGTEPDHTDVDGDGEVSGLVLLERLRARLAAELEAEDRAALLVGPVAPFGLGAVHDTLAELLDADGGHRPGDDPCDNRLRIPRGLDNTLHLDGQLCGEGALIAEHAMNAKADELFHRYRADQELSADLRMPHHPVGDGGGRTVPRSPRQERGHVDPCQAGGLTHRERVGPRCRDEQRRGADR